MDTIIKQGYGAISTGKKKANNMEHEKEGHDHNSVSVNPQEAYLKVVKNKLRLFRPVLASINN